MKTIYLVRHGEALDDIEDRYGGWSDDPLTEKGRETAEQLAGKIIRLSPKPTKIYSSPFKRAFETAEIIGDKLGLKPVSVGNLKERNRYGILTSMTKTEAKTAYPQMVQQVENYMETIQGAETYEHYRDRVLRAVNEIVKESKENTLIVCHGGTFRIVMWKLLRKPDYERADLNAILTIEENNGRLALKNSEGLIFKS
ncbi:MAG: hypothetical protein A2864_00185 [Candidatus Woykebacteria bacterium RIFCSPHIGHO2_01_FULL_39_12]|uniref:Phosphoglycerate mutase n=2 Tax=Candidatus Woykeibacteriota TaxID=1817899 RepID=A0A1G1WEG1_9BACT|nr:MAG: hypothetical protein A2134_01780 [Candidatus Woykebacteria bacterium RBG_16_39_9b]OGY28015.1 MAG: hypothetical protein A2864_00185 [Candidatus Woykebacteria bacterium RIFCSPHIGHO2_01_FULL_39_12]